MSSTHNTSLNSTPCGVAPCPGPAGGTQYILASRPRAPRCRGRINSNAGLHDMAEIVTLLSLRLCRRQVGEHRGAGYEIEIPWPSSLIRAVRCRPAHPNWLVVSGYTLAQAAAQPGRPQPAPLSAAVRLAPTSGGIDVSAYDLKTDHWECHHR